MNLHTFIEQAYLVSRVHWDLWNNENQSIKSIISRDQRKHFRTCWRNINRKISSQNMLNNIMRTRKTAVLGLAIKHSRNYIIPKLLKSDTLVLLVHAYFIWNDSKPYNYSTSGYLHQFHRFAQYYIKMFPKRVNNPLEWNQFEQDNLKISVSINWKTELENIYLKYI